MARDGSQNMRQVAKESQKYLKGLMGWVEVEKRVEEAQSTINLRQGTLPVKQLPKTMKLIKLGLPKPNHRGKTVVEVDDPDNRLEKFKAGDSICLFPVIDNAISVGEEGDASGFSTGMMVSVDERVIISLDEAMLVFDHPEITWAISTVANSVTFKRMLRILTEMNRILRNYKPDATSRIWLGSARLIPLLLAPSKEKEKYFTRTKINDMNYYNQALNEDQKNSVKLALSVHQAAVIHGPPGTGKTHTLVEVIQQFVGRNQKVLVCGPSHTSIDKLLARVVGRKVDCLRIGQLENLTDKKLEKTLLVSKIKAQGGDDWHGEYRKIKSILRSISNCRSSVRRRELNNKLKRIRARLSAAEKKAADKLIPKTQVVFSSLSACGARILEGHKFHVVIIDEATQAMEPDCWLAISHADKVIFAGDHHQLPPVVKSNEKGLDATLFKRLLEATPSIVQMLTEQFRMHEKIMHYSSKNLYEGKLFANPKVQNHLLTGLNQVSSAPISSTPLNFINTNKSKLDERPSGLSKYNPGEIHIVIQYLRKLLKLGLTQASIAIISPYSGQVDQLKKRTRTEFPRVKVGSVDGFQGSECEAVIISLVRSNSLGQVGFLKDYRRLNVAITRARRHLCIVGNGDTITEYYLKSNAVDNDPHPIHHNFLFGLASYLSDFVLTN